MQEEKLLKLSLEELNKLHEDDSMVSIKRDVNVNKHLPFDVIGKGLEFQSISMTEDIEFNNIWAELNSTMDDLYIQSAGQRGINRYVQLIDENIKGDLEEMRKMAFFLWNKKNVYTDRTLREMLDDLLGSGNYDLDIVYNDYALYLDLLQEKLNINIFDISRELREIIPANLLFILSLIYSQNLYLGMYGLKTRYSTMLPPDALTDYENGLFFGSVSHTTRTIKAVVEQPELLDVESISGITHAMQTVRNIRYIKVEIVEIKE